MVRVRASVTRPEHGWGDVDHTSIGPVHSLAGTQVIVAFPEHAFWIGLTSELEVVDHSGGETLLKKKTLKKFLDNFQKQPQRPPRGQKMG